MKSSARLFLTSWLLVSAACSPPKSTGYTTIVDEPHFFSLQQSAKLSERLLSIQRSEGYSFRVYVSADTCESAGDNLQRFADRAAIGFGLDTLRIKNMVVLYVRPKCRRLFLATYPAAEWELSDSLASTFVKQLTAQFKNKSYEEGLNSLFDSVIARMHGVNWSPRTDTLLVVGDIVPIQLGQLMRSAQDKLTRTVEGLDQHGKPLTLQYLAPMETVIQDFSTTPPTYKTVYARVMQLSPLVVRLEGFQ